MVIVPLGTVLVKVFPSTGVTDEAKKDRKEGLVYGKRYSKEEDEIVMNAKHPWTPEELEKVKKLVEKHGQNWRLLGRWSQDKYQSLFDLVNMDLSKEVTEEKKPKHGMLRDNICWTAISGKMLQRNFISCEGVWVDVDPFSSLATCCIEDVDWDNLLEHRPGDLCRKRWSQMFQYFGPNKDVVEAYDSKSAIAVAAIFIILTFNFLT
ncbi:uncharacterized protein LOC128286860 [Gossypium arboreum]|uniref:uncharacterized protein LOC128286860 n=1 Tax=Gossypium arboreum TaxID=29729 RepID=UPI0022F1D45C|nr:uncharacterized protein LOC128286860 [Gossypium arboreum]